MAVGIVGAEGAMGLLTLGQDKGVQHDCRFGLVVGVELAAFLGVAKEGNAWRVNFDRKKATTGHKVVEQQTRGARAEFY